MATITTATALKAPRVIVIGGGIGGLVAALQALQDGAGVDLFVKTFFLPDKKVEETLSAETKEYLAKYNVTDADLKDEKCYAIVHDKLVEGLKKYPRTKLRIMLGAKVTNLLLSQEQRALGVRYELELKESKQMTEANMFCDCIVLATNETALAEMSDLSKFKNGDVVTEHSEIVNDLLAVGNPLSIEESVSHGVKAGKRAAQSPIAIVGTNRVLGFTDKNGVYHESALSPDKWVPLVLQNRMQLNKYNHLFRFALPSATHQMGLLCGQYIAIRATIDGNELVRYYSPVNRNSDYGHLDLMIKLEGDLANKPMAKYLSDLIPGGILEFKGPMGGFEYHRNTWRAVGMIAGGTGITPMVQIIRSVSNHPEDKTHLHLLYGNYNEDDILCREELAYYGLTRTNIHVEISLANQPEHWSMSTGFVNKEMIKKHLPPPADDIIIVLCGPPPMIKAMLVHLKELGYTDKMIFNFY